MEPTIRHRPPHTDSEPAPPPWAWHRGVLALVAVLLMTAVAGAVYQRSYARGTASLKETSNNRLDLFASVVEARVRRLEPIPATIQLNPLVVHMLRPGQAGPALAANDYLARLNAHLGSAAVFVLDVRGVVRASSNLHQPDDSRLGESVAYRPYYLEALAGRSSRHFAMGSGGQAGYFAAHPIYDGPAVVGVAVIKIGLDALEPTWDMLGAPALVSDANQVVILSAQPAWRYTAMAPLTPDQRVDMRLSRMYGDVHLAPFPLAVDMNVDVETQEIQGFLQLDSTAASAAGLPPGTAGYLVLGRSLDGMDWRVLTFTDLTAVHRQSLLDAAGGALAVAVVVFAALYLAQRRRTEREKLAAKWLLESANAALEQKVALRTQELTDANALLRREVTEREHTEKNLRAAQDELVHAGKMAVLGQLAASITHELTQPLGGIRTLAGNAAEFLRRDQPQIALDNLAHVDRLVGHMASIIEPLKNFARKSTACPGRTDAGQIVAQALFLFQLRLRHEQVSVHNGCPLGHWWVWCDANRLEQVLINLIGNALDAMRDTPQRQLRIQGDIDDNGAPATLCLQVQDNGKGLSPTDLAHLFQPFYTTKPGGAGLGLGLVICRDIAAEFGGSLQAHNGAQGGACFSLRIPLAPPSPASADLPAP